MFKSSNTIFSIVIPTLNEEKYLPKLLDDLSKQTLQEFEVIVVDGHSDDKTIRESKKFAKKLPMLRIIESKRRNVSFQRNLGAGYVKSEWIIFMDADDRLPQFFLEGINYKINLTKADVFTSWINVDSEVAADNAIANIINIGGELKKMINYPGAMGAMIGIKTDGFKEVGGFNESIPYAEDGVFIRDCYKKGLKFQIFRDPIFIYSLRRHRRSGRLNIIRKHAYLQLKRIANRRINQENEYPMGGNVELDKKEKYFFKNFNNDLKILVKKPKLLKKLKSLLVTLDDDFRNISN